MIIFAQKNVMKDMKNIKRLSPTFIKQFFS